MRIVAEASLDGSSAEVKPLPLAFGSRDLRLICDEDLR